MFASARFAVAVVLLVMVAAAAWFLRASGYTAGVAQRDLECRAEVAAIESRAIEAERQAGALREKGRILADKLAQQAADAQAALDAAHKEAQREIDRRASASRRTLDAALVRLLNNLTPIRESGGGGQTSTASAGAAAQVSSTRSDSAGFASERAVVRAIADCRIGYESCRQRHSALAEWAESVTR